MVEIFGLLGDAAAVESHRREGALLWHCEIAREAQREGEEKLRKV